MLTRIYGISFPKKSMLDEYLALMEEAKKRDHRKLGKELELFAFSQRVGAGLPLWLPKGAALRDRLEQFLRSVQKRVRLPAGHHAAYRQRRSLYVTSGHYAKYGKDSFQPIHTPDRGRGVPAQTDELSRTTARSTRSNPARTRICRCVWRSSARSTATSRAGELHGLTRVRGFTQDDAHMFVRPDQLLEEFEKVIDIILYIFRTLKFDNYTAQISLRDQNEHAKSTSVRTKTGRRPSRRSSVPRRRRD